MTPHQRTVLEDWKQEDPRVGPILDDPRLSRDEKTKAMEPIFADMYAKRDSLLHRYEDLQRESAVLTDSVKALEGIREWGHLPTYALEKNEHTRLHKLIEAHAAGKVIGEDGNRLPPEHAPWLTNAKPFVVQHDWAAAFRNATDYAEGDFKLPYQECAFEFRISGRTVIVVSFQPDEETLAKFPEVKVTTPTLPYVECPGGFWYCGGESARDERVMQFVWEQVRAISIALDAEVATRDVVRAPTALNAKRLRDGKGPVYDFHIVKLRGRQVRQQLPSAGGTHRSPRLHFRRGHWRHYESHKTWIRWMLVGDPELGFVDKAYRL